MGIRCTDHVTPLYPQKLALTLPTGGGRSVIVVRSRTKATEFSLVSFMGREHLANVDLNGRKNSAISSEVVGCEGVGWIARTKT